jgi:hypothetical protein
MSSITHTDPVLAAKEAHLLYTSDDQPGFTRCLSSPGYGQKSALKFVGIGVK